MGTTNRFAVLEEADGAPPHVKMQAACGNQAGSVRSRRRKACKSRCNKGGPASPSASARASALTNSDTSSSACSSDAVASDTLSAAQCPLGADVTPPVADLHPLALPPWLRPHSSARDTCGDGRWSLTLAVEKVVESVLVFIWFVL